MSATINVQASQAAAEFQLIPEFNFGTGWVSGLPRKEVLTAIKPNQLSFHGSRRFAKGDKIRICVKAVAGNIAFKSETLDPGGSLETLLPAAIFYFELNSLPVGKV